MSPPPFHHKESPVFAADRAAFWRHLRELGPVVEITVGDPMLRGYYLTRRDDVRTALLDPDTFASPPKTFAIALFGVPLPQVPLSCGTRSEHARFGRVLHPLFSPKALAPFAPVLFAQAATLVDTIAAKGQCDATSVADTYACRAQFTVCGLPANDAKATQLTRAAVVGDSTGAAQLELVKWLNTSLDAGLSNPRRPPGILWPLLEGLAGDKDFPLSKVEVVAVILLLFSVAGIEMAAAAIGFALLHLARDPQLQTHLREDPAQIPAFVEEILRLEPPGPAIPRMTTREVNIGGVTIPAHSAVWLALEAAGREKAGDEISRTSSGKIRRQRHWAFGGGMHRCLGMHLARLEMVAFVTEWLCRIPNFELEPGSTPAIEHKPTSVTHLGSLMLRWEPSPLRIADDTHDADLESNIREFLKAVNERPDELLHKHLTEVEKPDSQDMEDFQRYVNDLKRIYGQGLLDMYGRIASHGLAICELTDETEVTERVEKIMTLVALDRDDVPKILASFEDAANELNPAAIARLFATIQAASARGLPRQSQRDELVLDLTTYCLRRFPPSDDD